MQNIIILHARAYDFKDEKTGKEISGIKVSYIFSDDLEPLTVDGKERGYSVAQATLPLEKDKQISGVPGVYTAKFTNSVNAKQQVVQRLTEVSFICTVPELFVNNAIEKEVAKPAAAAATK